MRSHILLPRSPRFIQVIHVRIPVERLPPQITATLHRNMHR